jgi:DNA-binding NtrC family response regulator
MIALLRRIADVARGEWNVLIEGETGAGKELVARAIHAASSRRDGPYVAVNCAGWSDSLLASQLFGHRRGAFTGAVSDQLGLFESARGGTLFLDEIGDVSPKVQVLLLRAIQEKEILRVGDTKPRRVDVRILAATHRRLAENSEFRADLLYRIRTGRITVPPLRERQSDIPLLCQAFLARGRIASGRTTAALSKEALDLLCDYPWPGNVRELKAALEHCLIHCHKEVIDIDDLPPEIQEHAALRRDQECSGQASEILNALERTQGNRTQAAQMLGIGRATLYRRMRALNLSSL